MGRCRRCESTFLSTTIESDLSAIDNYFFPKSSQQEAEVVFAECKGKDNFVNYKFKEYKVIQNYMQSS
jgi:hypothetical protein